MATFEEVFREPYSHILLDLSQNCPEALRYKANICQDPFYVSTYTDVSNLKSHKLGDETVYEIDML